jgi:hypothetical protein
MNGQTRDERGCRNEEAVVTTDDTNTPSMSGRTAAGHVEVEPAILGRARTT